MLFAEMMNLIKINPFLQLQLSANPHQQSIRRILKTSFDSGVVNGMTRVDVIEDSD